MESSRWPSTPPWELPRGFICETRFIFYRWWHIFPESHRFPMQETESRLRCDFFFPVSCPTTPDNDEDIDDRLTSYVSRLRIVCTVERWHIGHSLVTQKWNRSWWGVELVAIFEPFLMLAPHFFCASVFFPNISHRRLWPWKSRNLVLTRCSWGRVTFPRVMPAVGLFQVLECCSEFALVFCPYRWASSTI